MKTGLRFSLTLLISVPALAGEGPVSSPKGVLDPTSPDGSSAKGTLDFFPPAAAESKSRWTVGAGVAWRKIGRIGFDTGASRFQVPGVFGGSSFTPPPGIGAETGLIARVYDDGFIRPEPRTAATGRTTDYEYVDGSQIRTDHLMMSAGGGERRVVNSSSNSMATSWTEEDDWQVSPFLSLSRITPLGKGWSAGPTFHFSFTNVDGSRDGLGTLFASERRDIFDVRAFDRFDTTGLVLPQAPYTGSPGAVAPLVPVEPSSRTFEDTLRSTDLAFFNDSIRESLDVNLFGFSLGADAFYQDDDGFFVGLGTGLVVNVADWDARRSDRLFQVTNGGAPVEINSMGFRESGTDVLFGAYLQGALGIRLSDSVSIQGNVRYDWNESLRDSVGDSDFDVDLSGFSVGLSVNYFF
jgi:hypothetical protein